MSNSFADGFLNNDISEESFKKWEFVSDEVMGGISKGNIKLKKNDDFYIRMTGNVSLENNGGFIQFRRNLDNKLTKSSKGIKLKVRGNNKKYYIHLRTPKMLPWQYYQASFTVNNDWKEIYLLFSEFKRSGWTLSKNVNPEKITTIAVVAFGEEFDVLIDVEKILFK
tara:strand:+ start:92 stop:592 length:501 start_codon:yes stop_codon:yes gene_type:complete